MDDIQIDEMGLLKNQARILGIKHSNNISLESLKAKIAEHLNQDEPDEEVVQTTAQMAAELRKEAEQLIRCRISCMNPSKTDIPGEVIRVGNKHIGSIGRFVPFNNEGEYHLEKIIYDAIKDRKYMMIKVSKDPRTGRDVYQQVEMKEFNIEVLPPLTSQEIEELKAAQAAAGVIV